MHRLKFTLAAAVLYPQLAFAQDEPRTFTYVEANQPATVNPIFAQTTSELHVAELIFDSLFSFDEYLQPAKALVRTYEVADDHRSITMQLAYRTWHDGSPIRARDVVFTIDAYLDPQTDAPERSTLSFISKATAEGPRTLVLEFDRPILEPERLLTFKILPKHRFPGAPPIKKEEGMGTRGVLGSGKYRYRDWQGNKIRFQRQVLEGSAIQRIEANFDPVEERRLRMMELRAIDALLQVPPLAREGMAELDHVELYPYESRSWWYLGLNHRNKHLAKREVRAAIASALDRDKIRSAHLGDGETITGPFSPHSPFYDRDIEPRTLDTELADALMRKAGYSSKDGIFTFKGKPLELRFVASTSWAGSRQDAILDIQSHLQRAGFDVEVERLDPAAYRKRVFEERDFDITVGVWSFDEGANVLTLFHSEGAKNYVGYRNAKLDALMTKASQLIEPEAFKEANMEIHRLAARELPYIFLWSLRSYSAISTDVERVEIHPFRYFTWLHKWRWRDGADTEGGGAATATTTATAEGAAPANESDPE